MSLSITLARAADEERRGALRRLLVTPLLGQREDPEGYAAVVRHRRALAEWFAEHTGWSLVVDESGGFARLHKTRAHPDASRPATTRGRSAVPFTRRRYMLACLALAALDQRAGQTTLKHLADAVAEHSAELDAVEPFDATRHTDRRALVDALRLLAGLSVLTERDGDAERYAGSGSGDALFDVDDRRVAQLVAAPSSPSLVAGPADLPVEVYPDTEEGQRLCARHRVMRRLLDDPVVYYDDLDEREREWLLHSLRFVQDVLDRDVGLAVERRAEGIAAIDPAREVTGETFPDGSSTVKHTALLMAEHLTARARAADDGRDSWRLTDQEAGALATDLVGAYGTRCGWSEPYRQDPAALARDALALLERFGLVARRPDGWQPRPAIARFAPAAPGAGGTP